MAVTYDNSAKNTAASPATSPLSWSHTIGTGNNRLLVVAALLEDANTVVSSGTYGAVALTAFDTLTIGSAGNRLHVSVWYLLNPASGTDTISLVLSEDADDGMAMSMSFSEVDPASPLTGKQTHSATSGTSATVSVTSDLDDMVIDFMLHGYAEDVVPSGGQTTRQAAQIGATGAGIRGEEATSLGAVSVTCSYTWANSDGFALMGINVECVQSRGTMDAMGALWGPGNLTQDRCMYRFHRRLARPGRTYPFLIFHYPTSVVWTKGTAPSDPGWTKGAS